MDPFNVSLVSFFGKKYEKEDMSLDNMHFSDCSFDGCNFVYAGGPVVLDKCLFHNCELKIQGSAAIVVESLRRFGFHVSPPEQISESGGPKEPTIQ